MNVHPTYLTRHPPSQGERARWGALAFGLLAGPAAWFAQVCAGYMLASGPCFPHETRRLAPPTGLNWTWPALVAILAAGVLLALAACWVSWRELRRTSPSSGGHDLLEIETGRTRFLATWGVVYGAGFALATLITAVAYILLPRCAG